MKMISLATLVVLKVVLTVLCVIGIGVWAFWLFPFLAAFRNGMPGSGLRLLSMAIFGAWLLFCAFPAAGSLVGKSFYSLVLSSRSPFFSFWLLNRGKITKWAR